MSKPEHRPDVGDKVRIKGTQFEGIVDSRELTTIRYMHGGIAVTGAHYVVVVPQKDGIAAHAFEVPGYMLEFAP